MSANISINKYIMLSLLSLLFSLNTHAADYPSNKSYFDGEIQFTQQWMCEEKGSRGFYWKDGKWNNIELGTNKFIVTKIDHRSSSDFMCSLAVKSKIDEVTEGMLNLNRCFKLTKYGTDSGDVSICKEVTIKNEGSTSVICHENGWSFTTNTKQFLNRSTVLDTYSNDDYKTHWVSQGICVEHN